MRSRALTIFFAIAFTALGCSTKVVASDPLAAACDFDFDTSVQVLPQCYGCIAGTCGLLDASKCK